MLSVYNEQSKLRKSIYLGAVDFIPKDEFAHAVLLKTLQQLHILGKTWDMEKEHNVKYE